MTTITLTIERPEGHTEIVDLVAKGYTSMNDVLFARIKEATAKAGRGTVVSYSYEITRSDAERERTDVDIMFDKADAAEDHNYSLYLRLRDKAEAALAAWKETYPDDVAAKTAEVKADRERRLRAYGDPSADPRAN